jgi:hypothetical protein
MVVSTVASRKGSSLAEGNTTEQAIEEGKHIGLASETLRRGAPKRFAGGSRPAYCSYMVEDFLNGSATRRQSSYGNCGIDIRRELSTPPLPARENGVTGLSFETAARSSRPACKPLLAYSCSPGRGTRTAHVFSKTVSFWRSLISLIFRRPPTALAADVAIRHPPRYHQKTTSRIRRNTLETCPRRFHFTTASR